MCQQVDRQRTELFWQRIGRLLARPGLIYLVGGTTMVYEGFRQQTLDINISFQVANDDHGAFVAAVRELKETLSLNIVEVSPSDFIPLPSGYSERSQYIGRYGRLDVFHFDLYSTALSKIERGTESDFDDVLTLLQSGRHDMAGLCGCFNEIMPRYATHSLMRDPAEFRRKFAILKEVRYARSGTQ